MKPIFIILLSIISILVILYLVIGSFIGYDFIFLINLTSIKNIFNYFSYKINIENEAVLPTINNKKYILVLRGHIRNSFENNKLYNLIKSLTVSYNIDIYIHTWNIFASIDSYRYIKENINTVTSETIYNYFKDLSIYIKHIIIDDSKDVLFIGNIEGNVSKSRLKIKSWKCVWYAQHKIMKYIKDNTTNESDIIINTRFDLLSMTNFIKPSQKSAVNFIIKTLNNMENNVKTDNFFAETSFIGIDNIFIMKKNIMYNIFKEFYYNLDNILINYPNESYIEFILYNTSLKFM